MDGRTIVEAIMLGLIEGLTEFIPVSSTAHLLLAGHFLGFDSPGRTFEVLIQLGAILALVSVYFARLLKLALTLPSDPKSRRFVAGIVIAFLPAAFVGVLGHSIIKTVLFESPMAIAITLIVGGFVLMAVDRMELKPRYRDVMDYPLPLCLAIGACQALAVVPGVSRSGATIVGALLMGADKRSAAEFSFFLAMPTMAGAFTYDLWKNRDILSADSLLVTALGFAAAFVAGLVVVKSLLDYVSAHGFRLFAWWRIAVGSVALVALLIFG